MSQIKSKKQMDCEKFDDESSCGCSTCDTAYLRFLQFEVEKMVSRSDIDIEIEDLRELIVEIDFINDNAETEETEEAEYVYDDYGIVVDDGIEVNVDE